MTTIATTALSDALPSSVPKLDTSGTNWAIFVFRFQDAVEAKGFWGHFSGSTPAPVAVDPAKPTSDESAAKAQWDKNERSAKSLLTQKLPDSTVVMIHAKVTVKERWDAVVKEFSKKSAYAQADLRAKFMGMKCSDKANPREFLEGLRLKKEELVQAGVVVDEKDYFSVIISSLPMALSNFASNQLAAAQFSSTKTMTPDDLLSMLMEESDRQRAQRVRRQGSGRAKDDDNEALAAEASKSNGKGKSKNPNIECWNCGKKGHISRFCRKPKKSTDSKDEKKGSSDGKASKGSTSANAAEEEGAWAAEEETDWFSDEDDEEVKQVVVEDKGGNDSDDSSFIEDFDDASRCAFVVTEAAATTKTIELYDSGCSNHISPYRECFENFENTAPKQFRAANQQTFSAVGKGDLIVEIPDGDGFSKLRLTDVLYSPNVGYTLVSIGRLDDDGFTATFGKKKCVIHGPDGEKIGEVARTARRVYRIEHDENAVNAAEEFLTLEQFHRRMGHIAIPTARQLVRDKLVTGVRLEYTPSNKEFFCESCVHAKATRKEIPKKREGERATVFGGEVHSDLWGKCTPESLGGKSYWETFIDDKSRLTHLYFLRTKDEAPDAYKKYEAWVNTQMDKKIKILNSDRGGEYQGRDFVNYLKTKGTVQKLNVHDTPQHAGVAERRNRTIGERVRALLHASGLPKFLWAEAARHAVWLLNRTTTKAVEGMTPYEAAFGKKPNLKGLREWGEKVYVRIEGGTKLGGRVREGKWLGVDEESKGVRVYWPDTKNVTVERNVYYDNASACRSEGEQDIEIVETKADAPSTTAPSTDKTSATVPDDPEKAKRIRKPAQRVLDLLEGRATWSNRSDASKTAPGIQLLAEEEADNEESEDWATSTSGYIEEYVFAAEVAGSEALEPQSLKEAKARPDWPLWEKAIEEELEVLRAAGTWELVNAPEGANIVGSKWVFRAKKDAAGNVVRYKARLVAQGFSQVPGVDYFDTFAPVARLASIRTVLAFAAANDLETGQIDIKGAYLNGELTENETIFMKQAPGYAIPNPDGGVLVCKL